MDIGIGIFGKLTSQSQFGNITTVCDQKTGKKISETVCDNDGKKLSISYFDENGNVTAETVYTYHTNGKIKDITLKDKNGNKLITATNSEDDNSTIDSIELKNDAKLSDIIWLPEFLSADEFRNNNKGETKTIQLRDKSEYEYANEPLIIKDSDGMSLQFNYKDDNLTEITYSDGRIYQKFTDDGIETCEYDSNGNLIRSITDKGQVTKYEHTSIDGKNVLKAVTYDKDPDVYQNAKIQNFYYYNDVKPDSKVFKSDYTDAYSQYICDTYGNLLCKAEFDKLKDGMDDRHISSIVRYTKTEQGQGFSLGEKNYKALATEIYNKDGEISQIRLKDGVDISEYTPPVTGSKSIELVSEKDNKVIAVYEYNNGYISKAYKPADKTENSPQLLFQSFQVTKDNNGIFAIKKIITNRYEKDKSGNYKISETVNNVNDNYIKYDYKEDENGNEKIIASVFDKKGSDRKLLSEKVYAYSDDKTVIKILSQKDYKYNTEGIRTEAVNYKTVYAKDSELTDFVASNPPGSIKQEVDFITRYDSTGKEIAEEKNTDDDDYVETVKLITQKDGKATGITIDDYTPPKSNKPNSTLTATDSDDRIVAIYSYNALGYLDINSSSTNIEYSGGKLVRSIANNGKITEFGNDGISIYSEKKDKRTGETERTEYWPNTGLTKTVIKYDDENNIMFTQEYNEQGYPKYTKLDTEELSDYNAPSVGMPGGVYKIYDKSENVVDIVLYDSQGNKINKLKTDSYETDKNGNLTKYTTKSGNVILFTEEDNKIKVTRYKKDPVEVPDAEITEITYFNSYEEMSSECEGTREIWDCDKDGKLLSKIIDSPYDNVVQVSYEEVSTEQPGSINIGGKYYVESAKTKFGEDGYPESIVLKTNNLANFEVPQEYYEGGTIPVTDENGNTKGYIKYDENGALHSVIDTEGNIYKAVAGSVTTTYEYTETASGRLNIKRATASNGNVTLFETVNGIVKATKYENDPDDSSKPQKILSYTEYETENGTEIFRDTYKYDKSGALTEISRKEYTPESTSKLEMGATLNQRICLEGQVRQGSERVTQITQYSEIQDGSKPDYSLNGKNYKIVSIATNNDTDNYVDKIEIFGDVEDYTPPTFNEKGTTVNAYKDGKLVALYAYNNSGRFDNGESSTQIVCDANGNLVQSTSNNNKITKYDDKGGVSSIYEDKFNKTTGVKTSTVYYNPKTGKQESQIFYNSKTGEETSKYYYNDKNAITKIELKNGKLEYINPPAYNVDGKPIQVFGSDGKICAEYVYRGNGNLNYKESVINGFKFDASGKVIGFTNVSGKESTVTQDANGNYVLTGYNASVENGKKTSIKIYPSYEDLMNKTNILKEEENTYSKINPGKRVTNITKEYDSNGKVKSRIVRRFDDNAQPTFTEKYEYSALKEVQVFNSSCSGLPVAYGPKSSEVKMTDKNGKTIGAYIYDSDGTVIESRNQNGNTLQTYKKGKLDSQYEYSGGKISAIKHTTGAVTKFEYSGNSIISYKYSPTDVENKDYSHPVEITKFSEYKSYSERKEIERVKVEYDEKGNKTKETAYEPNKKLISKVTNYDSDGRTVKCVTEYSNGSPVSATVQNGMKITDYIKPEKADANQEIIVKNESGTVLGTCIYSSLGKISTLTDAEDRIIRQYTSSGKFTDYTYNNGGAVSNYGNLKTTINSDGFISNSEVTSPTEETLKEYKKQDVKTIEEIVENPNNYTPPPYGEANSVTIIKDKSGKTVATAYYDGSGNYIKKSSLTSIEYKNGVPVKSVDARGYETEYKKNGDGTITAIKGNKFQNNIKVEEAVYASVEDLLIDNYKEKTTFGRDGTSKISQVKPCTDSNGNTGKSITYYVDGKPSETKTYFADTVEGPHTMDTYIKYDASGKALYTEKYSLGVVYSIKLNNINIEDYTPKSPIMARNVTIPIYNSTNKKIGSYAYDSNGCPASLQDGNGVTVKTYCNGKVQYTFQNGQPVNSTDAAGNKYTWTKEGDIWKAEKKDSSGKWLATLKYASIDDIIKHNIISAQLTDYAGSYKTVTPLDASYYSVKEVKNNVTFTKNVEKAQYVNLF